jgi:hypothetical protein
MPSSCLEGWFLILRKLFPALEEVFAMIRVNVLKEKVLPRWEIGNTLPFKKANHLISDKWRYFTVTGCPDVIETNASRWLDPKFNDRISDRRPPDEVVALSASHIDYFVAKAIPETKRCVDHLFRRIQEIDFIARVHRCIGKPKPVDEARNELVRLVEVLPTGVELIPGRIVGLAEPTNVPPNFLLGYARTASSNKPYLSIQDAGIVDVWNKSKGVYVNSDRVQCV